MKRRKNILLKLPFQVFFSIILLLLFFNTESYCQKKTGSGTSTYQTNKVPSRIKTNKKLAANSKSKYKSRNAVKTREDLSMKNIYRRVPSSIFRENQTIIDPLNLVILDSIADYLLKNPQIKMEIGVHTDTRWVDDNNNFTEKRSKVICDYLEYRGVSRTRLSCKGYGKSKPLVSDAAIKRMKNEKSKEMAHQKNRRIEFKTITN